MNISTKKNEEDFVTIYTNATLKIEKKTHSSIYTIETLN